MVTDARVKYFVTVIGCCVWEEQLIAVWFFDIGIMNVCLEVKLSLKQFLHYIAGNSLTRVCFFIFFFSVSALHGCNVLIAKWLLVSISELRTVACVFVQYIFFTEAFVLHFYLLIVWGSSGFWRQQCCWIRVVRTMTSALGEVNVSTAFRDVTIWRYRRIICQLFETFVRRLIRRINISKVANETNSFCCAAPLLDTAASFVAAGPASSPGAAMLYSAPCYHSYSPLSCYQVRFSPRFTSYSSVLGIRWGVLVTSNEKISSIFVTDFF